MANGKWQMAKGTCTQRSTFSICHLPFAMKLVFPCDFSFDFINDVLNGLHGRADLLRPHLGRGKLEEVQRLPDVSHFFTRVANETARFQTLDDLPQGKTPFLNPESGG